MRQSSSTGRAEVAKFKFFVLQENVFNFDVPVSDWRLLIVHMKNASAQVLQYMDHLLLVEASWTEFN